MGYAALYDPVAEEWLGGVGARVMMGGTLSSKLLLGAQFDSWGTFTGSESDFDFRFFSSVMAGIQFYPSANSGLHLIAGAGLTA